MRAVLVPASLLTALSLTAVGCTPEPAPEPPAPKVIWSPGPPEGELESDPRVQAIRESDLALQNAINARDYTGKALTDSTDSTVIELAFSRQSSFARDWEQQFDAESPYFWSPGPTPMIILSVEEGENGRGIVITCSASNWRLDAEHSTPPSTLEGRIVQNGYSTTPSGSIVSDTGGGPTTESCDLTGVSVGLFDPQPDVTETYSPDDVKGP